MTPRCQNVSGPPAIPRLIFTESNLWGSKSVPPSTLFPGILLTCYVWPCTWSLRCTCNQRLASRILGGKQGAPKKTRAKKI